MTNDDNQVKLDEDEDIDLSDINPDDIEIDVTDDIVASPYIEDEDEDFDFDENDGLYPDDTSTDDLDGFTYDDDSNV